jgi:hypothetical protein
MVADIAACFGKSAQLNRQVMVYYLFRHGAAMIVRDVAARVGERIIVKQAGLRVIRQTLRRTGIQVTRKTVGKTLSRWLPIIGPILIGCYLYLQRSGCGQPLRGYPLFLPFSGRGLWKGRAFAVSGSPRLRGVPDWRKGLARPLILLLDGPIPWG